VRVAVLLIALAGCGRLGFDDVLPVLDPGDAGPTDGSPATTPNICSPRTITGFSIGAETPVKVRATQLSTGFAVAVETSAANVYVARIDAAGALVSMHLPFAAGYTLHGISQIADRPFVYVFTSGGGYIKMLVPDWNSYDTGPSGEELSMDPQQAILPGATTAMFGTIAGGQLSIAAIDATGATSITADYAPTATSASFAPVPNGARVVVDNAGVCETFAIAADGTTGTRHAISPCHAPLLAMVDGNIGGVLHQTATGGPLALHLMTAPDAGTTSALEIATNARIAVIGGALWVAYLRGVAARLIRFDGQGSTTHDFPAIDAVFDLIPKAAFWIDANGLQTGEPCL
jgi:hypothetical protein